MDWLVNNFNHRTPVEDGQYENERTVAYWNWLESAYDNCTSNSEPIALDHTGLELHQLKNDHDADFEAIYMSHSIGHSWGKYSALGDIYSIREPYGRPLVTLLVIDGVVVHAREDHNAALSEKNQGTLTRFADSQEWQIRAEPPFLVSLSDEQNTAINYCFREADSNRKYFGRVVFSGRPSQEALKAKLSEFPTCVIDLKSWGLTPLSPTNPGRYELLSIQSTDEPADEPLKALLDGVFAQDTIPNPSQI